MTSTLGVLLRSPLFYVQVVNAVIFLFIINSVHFSLAVAASAVLYGILVWLGHGAGIRWQRDAFNEVRQQMSKTFQLSRILEIEKDDWDRYDGAATYSRSLVALGVILFVAYVLEGRYFGMLNLAANTSYFYLAARSESKEVILFTGRFNTALQLLAAASVGSAFGPEAVRRMLLIRSLVSMAYFESIHELFCHTVLFPSFYIAFRFGISSALLELPWIHFFFTIFPTEIMGLRLWLLRKANKATYISPSSYVALVLMVVPFSVALLSFGRGTDPQVRDVQSSGKSLQIMRQTTLLRDAAIPRLLLSILPYLGFLVSALWFVWGAKVDELILRITANPGLARITRKDREPKTHSSIMLAAWTSTFCVLGLYGETLLAFSGVFVLLASRKASGDRDFNRALFLLYQIAVSAQLRSNPNDVLHLLLTGSRLWLCFESRSYSDVLAEMLFATSCHILYAPSFDVRKGILGIFACGLLVALALRLASENLDRFLNEAKAADSFLDHAIKQRLAALGSVMQHALDASEGCLDDLAERTLAQAVFETQLGLAACHLSSAAMRIESGTFATSPSRPCGVVGMLRSWGEENDILAVVPIEGEEWIEASLDWDLLRSLVIDMMRHHLLDCLDALERHDRDRDDWPVRIVVVHTGPRTFAIKIESRISGPKKGRKYELLRHIRESVSRALGGTFAADGDSIEFPFLMEEQSVVHLASSSVSSGEMSTDSPLLIKKLQAVGEGTRRYASPFARTRTLAGEGPSPIFDNRSRDVLGVKPEELGFPKNLSIAALDDNALVRVALGLVFRTHLGVNMARSFVVGATREEALQFPQRIIEARVQIALFDENLEYEEGHTIKGSALAIRAKQMGFRGCLVLHSANAALRESLDPCFDGFVEKSSSKDQFLRNLARVYERYLSRTLNAGCSREE